MWKLNTSNINKLAEFKRYLCDVEAISVDIREPDADALTVIQYKASQFKDTIVDDTVLDIDGEDVGVNIKWFLDNLDQFIGKKALFTCYVGICRNNAVEIYKGECRGQIVSPRGNSFGFNNSFLPDTESLTFGESIPDDINPRKLAIDNLLKNNTIEIREIMKVWTGSFQNE